MLTEGLENRRGTEDLENRRGTEGLENRRGTEDLENRRGTEGLEKRRGTEADMPCRNKWCGPQQPRLYTVGPRAQQSCSTLF